MHRGQLIISKNKINSIQRKHPWIFSGAISKIESDPQDGDIVKVLAPDKTVLAVGHFQKSGSISCRILAFADIEINQVFWVERFNTALKYRHEVLRLPDERTNAYRLIHGEGDGLPGLIIDVYNKCAVIQCHSAGMAKSLDQITSALQITFNNGLECIYHKSKSPSYSQNDVIASSILYGEIPKKLIVSENNLRFEVDIAEGQKTGFFLDQRDNRRMAQQFSENRSVLNLFSYTGGFSIYAAEGGAKSIVSVDISPTASLITQHNIELNNQNHIHQLVQEDVMKYLKSDSRFYDLVIVDPPAFAKSINKRHNAVQAYKNLNILAFKRVSKGGLMMSYSCSQVVGKQLFYDTITAAAIQSGRNIRVMGHLSQPADHPVNMFHPEGHYLKGLLLYVE
jgi:23S rRNA (cytosine1962-C5)-methyltransferase